MVWIWIPKRYAAVLREEQWQPYQRVRGGPTLLRAHEEYLRQRAEEVGYSCEMEVLFTLLAERYGPRSVTLTSNLEFSKWGQIFKDRMTTLSTAARMLSRNF